MAYGGGMLVVAILVPGMGALRLNRYYGSENFNDNLALRMNEGTRARSNSTQILSLDDQEHMRLAWPGCIISDQLPHKADLYGFGTCHLQPCSCQEIRWSSLVWGVAGKCDRLPGQIIDFVMTMRLDRGVSAEHPSDGPQEITTTADLEIEQHFAEAMKNVMSNSSRNQRIPGFEQIGFKLGYMDVSLQGLNKQLYRCGTWDPDSFAGSEKERTHLLGWGLPESFSSTNGTRRVSLEVRGDFPLHDIWRRFGPETTHRAIAPVLVSLGQAFQWYEDAKIAHCDRSANHILLRKSSVIPNMPSALVIDHDRVQNYTDTTEGEELFMRQQMLYWFATTVNNMCLIEKMEAPIYSSCSQSEYTQKYHESAKEAYKKFIRTSSASFKDSVACKGSHMLAETVVGPALRCSIGEDDCSSISAYHWTKKLQEWAEKYYGEFLHDESLVPDSLWLEETPER